MAEEYTLIAKSEKHTDEHQNTHDSHDSHQEESGGAGAIFNELLENVGDHKDFYYGPYKVFELPYIFIDDGLHFYWNKKQLEQSELYEITGHHGEITRKDTGLAPDIDLSPTNLVMFQWFAMLLLLFAFFRVGRKYKKNPNKAPNGFQNAIEFLVTFVRDDIVKSNIPNAGAARRLLPYFVSLFLFILTCNLMGLLPGGHTATGSILTTGSLAIISLFVINLTAMFVVGPGAWLKHLTGGTPWYMWAIMIPVEILGLFVKPFALMVRLFATMTAGHVILYSLLGILFLFGIFTAVVITPFSIFIYGLELIVAILQAYLFTILTAVFTGIQLEHEH
jgi:F-type H+-transporting ATPase subunit a